jgi:hypothetical protein
MSNPSLIKIIKQRIEPLQFASFPRLTKEEIFSLQRVMGKTDSQLIVYSIEDKSYTSVDWEKVQLLGSDNASVPHFAEVFPLQTDRVVFQVEEQNYLGKLGFEILIKNAVNDKSYRAMLNGSGKQSDFRYQVTGEIGDLLVEVGVSYSPGNYNILISNANEYNVQVYIFFKE